MNDDFIVEQYRGVDVYCSTEGYYAWIDAKRFGGEDRGDVREAINEFMGSL